MAAYLNRHSPDRRGGCHRSDLQPARRCMRQKARFRLIFWATAPIFRSFADGDGTRQLFALLDRGDYLESVEEIPEPHAFTAHVRLGGQSYAAVFEEHEHAEERRTAITICGPP